jgi:hypothetical protein
VNLDKKIIQFLSVELTCATLGSDQILTLFIKRRESQGHTQLSVVAADLLIFIRMLFFLTADFGCVTKKSCAPKNKQTIHSKMRHEKGKKSGGNRILASWQ